MSKPPFKDIYALWLMPDEASGGLLQGMINQLDKNLSTGWFISHMTLLGGLSAATQPKVIHLYETVDRFINSTATEPLTVELVGVGMRNLYVQSLFLLAAPTEGLLALHEEAKLAFGLSLGGAPFMPHASLVYGNLSYREKKACCAILHTAFDFPLTVTFDQVALFDCNGMPSQWQKMVNYYL